MPSAASDSTSIIGREREIARLQELLDGAIAGSGSLALVGGEAGIGKTTLVRHFIQMAGDRGCLVLTGGCYDLTTTPPYGPWVETIRDYQPSGIQPPPPVWFGSPDELAKIGNQPALFEELRLFYAGIANQQPLLMVLEDLHWSDPATPEALRYLARSLSDIPLLLVATYRDDEATRSHPFYESIPTLVRESETHRIDLRRWSEDDTRTFLADRYGLLGNGTERLTNYLQQLADGNPFYTMELLHTLEGDETLRLTGCGWELGELVGPLVPPLVRQVIERRLDRLSDHTRQLLEVAAVIGQQPRFDLWQQVGSYSDDWLVAVIDDALRSHLIDELPDRSGIQFRHALVRETLHARISAIQLRTWHQKVADALIGQPAPDPDRVAYHYGQARDPREVEWLIKAGERAERSYALISAAEHFLRAAEILDNYPDRLQERGWLLYRASGLLRWSDSTTGLGYATEAEQIGNQTADRWLETAARYDRGFHLIFLGRFLEAILPMEDACVSMDRALRSPQDLSDDSDWQGLVHIHPLLVENRKLALELDPEEYPMVYQGWGAFAALLFMTGRLFRAKAICDQLRPVAEDVLTRTNSSSNSVGYADAINYTGNTHLRLGNAEIGALYIQKGQSLYAELKHHAMVYNSCDQELDRFGLVYVLDDQSRVQAIANKISKHAGIDRWARATAYQTIMPGLIRLAIIRGDWSTAREMSNRALQDSTVPNKQRIFSSLAHINHFQGFDDLAWKSIVIALANGPDTKPGDYIFEAAIRFQQLAVHLSLDAKANDEVRAWLSANDRWLEWSGAVPGQSENRLLWAQYFLATDDRSRALNQALTALELASEPRQPLALIDAHRFLGEFLIDERDYATAGTHLATSLQIAEACQAPYKIALTWLAQAKLATATRDIQQATNLLERAGNTFSELGARPALERVEQLAATLAGLSHEYPDGLTPREAEVLALVARRLSNREIADRLHLSIRTVERHITNIYNKIGVHNRYDARDYARRHDLTNPDSYAKTT